MGETVENRLLGIWFIIYSQDRSTNKGSSLPDLGFILL